MLMVRHQRDRSASLANIAILMTDRHNINELTSPPLARRLPAADPAFEIASMHDAEHEDHSVLVDHVVHHAVIAYAESVERVAHAADGLDRLAADPTLLARVIPQLLQSLPEPPLDLRRELPERASGRWSEFDREGGQPRSLRLVVRPFA